ncbi:hypothetical protein WMY93_023650 [Mugilogobius chulae]|uniref:Sulfotransferase n=1 Tax=Mugilogobius chulae TaxID=88201 RepID=A0AAW0N9B0_9GOBI
MERHRTPASLCRLDSNHQHLQRHVGFSDNSAAETTWLRGRYLLVRYEDLALNPKDKTEDIYRFVGLDMDDKVLAWITKNTNSNSGSPSDWNYKYSTSRDSRATAESWRLRLSYDIVRTVQSLCNQTLSQLGYRPVHSAAQLRNLSQSLVELRTFQPIL